MEMPDGTVPGGEQTDTALIASLALICLSATSAYSMNGMYVEVAFKIGHEGVGRVAGHDDRIASVLHGGGGREPSGERGIGAVAEAGGAVGEICGFCSTTSLKCSWSFLAGVAFTILS